MVHRYTQALEKAPDACPDAHNILALHQATTLEAGSTHTPLGYYRSYLLPFQLNLSIIEVCYR